MKKVLFTGGGSAGHVLPNLALIEELLSTGETDVCYMGTDGIEKRLVAEWKIPYCEIQCPKLIRGGGFAAFQKNVKIPVEFSRAVKQAEEGLKTFRPQLVFSKGGYVSLPVVFAAKRLQIPCITHESDYSLGLANKIAAKKCECVLTSFPETAEKLSNGKYSGAPIRRSILHATRAEARRKFNIPFDEKVLLVFGGGSGSRILNESVRAHLRNLTKNYTILHVCGKGNKADTTFKNYRQEEFIQDMGEAYACADVVLSRAGAGTIFELLALKKPALLVPLEGSTRGDQKQNAEYFRKKGLCRILPQKHLDRLSAEINRTFGDVELRANLQETNILTGNENILQEIRKFLRK